MITDFSDSITNLSRGGGSNHATKQAHDETKRSKPRATRETNQRTHKKTVRFDANISCNLHSSEMTPGEKRAAWYDATDFERFKHEAAAEAGVKLVRCEKDYKFAMLGDFDGLTDPAGSGDGSNNAAEKLYHNENEYADSYGICRRGLGYHFSRHRRQSKAVCRSAVLAWQEMLRDPTNQTIPKLGDGDELAPEKACLTLALVSAKCSRVARAEAKWRGDVDYRVAHPERHAPAATSPSRTNENDGSARVRFGPLKKRMAGLKRERSGGICRGVGGKLTSAPVRRIFQKA